MIGPWFGTGADRGIALVFVVAGIIGLLVTGLALLSRPYRRLSAVYAERWSRLRGAPVAEPVETTTLSRGLEARLTALAPQPRTDVTRRTSRPGRGGGRRSS